MLKLRCHGVGDIPFSLLPQFSRLLLYSTVPKNPSLADYLVQSLGFSEQQSLSTSSKLARSRRAQGAVKVSGFNFSKKADCVVNFLRRNGLDESQIRNAISKEPRILVAKVEKTLEPKIRDFRQLGFSTPDLAHLISVNPMMLLIRLNPAIITLREVFGSDEIVVEFIRRLARSPLSTITKHLIPNVALLESYGIPLDKIRRYFAKQPSTFLLRTESLRDLLVRVEEKWGIDRDSSSFLYAVCSFSFHSEETIESKHRLFRSFGFADSHFQEIVKKNYYVLGFSEVRIKKAMEFCVNEMGCEPGYLASHPMLLSFSIEKRLAPRHRVLQVLKAKGLIKKDYQLYSAVFWTEPRFLMNFVDRFRSEVPDLHDIYVKSKSSSVVPKESA